jgi:hypothetical protein
MSRIYEYEHIYARVFRHLCMSMSRTHMYAGRMAWLFAEAHAKQPLAAYAARMLTYALRMLLVC